MDFKIIRKLLRDAIRIDRTAVPSCDVLTFACDTDRNFIYGGKAYSPLMNTVEDDLAKRGVTSTGVSRIASVLKGDKTHGTVISPEGGFARALIGKRLKALTNRRDYPYSYAEERVWDRLLEASGARVVVAIMPSRELCQVCKRRNIWVADLQHGVITGSHPWYDHRQRRDEPAEWVPDAFLVWDDGTADFLSTWVPQKGAVIRIIGNPWISRFRRGAADDKLVADVSARYPVAAQNKPRILVSLSWGTKNIPNGFIHPSLEQVMFETADRYTWHIRLHPNQIRGFAEDEGSSFVSYFGRRFGKTDIDWTLATEMPLPLLLSHTDLHITWSSSICMEAAGFGIRSLLLDPTIYPGAEKEDYFDYLVKAGYVDKARPDQQEISDWITQNVGTVLAPRSNHSEDYEAMLDTIAQIASGDVR